MTFPVETEASIHRRIMKNCQDHVRNIVSVVKELTLMVDSAIENKSKGVMEHYQSLLSMLENGEKLKNVFLREVVSVGSLLGNREDFLRFVFRIGDMADNAEGAAFRLAGIIEKKWKIEKKYLDGLTKLSSLLLDEVTKLRETTIALGFNPSKAIDLASAVEEVEKKIDSNYRNFQMSVLSSKMPLQSMLILRDIIEHIELIADIGVDVVDIVRLLALST